MGLKIVRDTPTKLTINPRIGSIKRRNPARIKKLRLSMSNKITGKSFPLNLIIASAKLIEKVYFCDHRINFTPLEIKIQPYHAEKSRNFLNIY